MGIRELNIKHSYIGKGKEILRDFLIPTLSESTTYDRITSFYSIESLIAISQGIDSLFECSGRMRLIIGIHSIPGEIIDAVTKKEFLTRQVAQIREDIKNDVSSISDLLVKNRIATIAWMVEDGLLEIKAVSVAGGGIFHPKSLILSDDNGNTVAAIGSPNETGEGLGGNFEQLSVFLSWEMPEAVDDSKDFFNSLWFNKVDDTYCFDITKDVAAAIKSSLGSGFENPHKRINNMVQAISDSKKMPAYFFVSGDIPALYMHQERAVLDALSRWPVRVLLSDEVGLGKTFEAAATLVYLVKYCGVKRVLILTPKSVLKQWQEELFENFGLSMWLYDSSHKKYIAPDGKIVSMQGKNPLTSGSPDMILMSAQLARGSGKETSLLEKEDTVLPELLIVDEAHSARVSKDISGKKKKTRMYKMIEAVKDTIPHIVLATATPMQTSSFEYHALLNLLGLPKQWKREKAFELSLKIIGSDKTLDITDAYNAAKLLCAVIDTMQPNVNCLEIEEKAFVNNLVELIDDANADNYDIGSYVIDNEVFLRRTLVKLHPARLLTVRNTRRALEEVGYQFPKRNLVEKTLINSDRIQLFYEKVNGYISDDCFSIERVLEPEKTLNIGFIRVNYQQRVASSLHSCKESLGRRYSRALQLRDYLVDHAVPDGFDFSSLDINESMDDIERDELFSIGDETIDLISSQEKIDIDELKRAVALECTGLGSLIEEVTALLKSPGDIKITQSVNLAIECMNRGDTVLLFSRYTDTVDALIEEFENAIRPAAFSYGVYTGKKSVVVRNGTEEVCDKSQIKKELFGGSIKIMFCSDAASEGLNLQAARVLINVDVPWTPARLEQRIGRIARLGQIAEEVDVYNVWYPNSIEARMYHRIQKRLEETNLAIGEFPEVVANRIKEAVLEDSDSDDSIKQLNDLRNSYQLKALEELWAENGKRQTTSAVIREKLVGLSESRFKIIATKSDGCLISLEMPDGNIVDITSESGMTESISLMSPIWHYTDFAVPNIKIKGSKSGIPVIFYSTQTETFMKPEAIFEIAMGESVSEDMTLIGMPNTLANNNALHLGFAVENYNTEAPSFWPPVEEE